MSGPDTRVEALDDLISTLLEKSVDPDTVAAPIDLERLPMELETLREWHHQNSVRTCIALARQLKRFPDTLSRTHAVWEEQPPLSPYLRSGRNGSSAVVPGEKPKNYLGIEVFNDRALHVDPTFGLHSDPMLVKTFAIISAQTVAALPLISPSLSYNPTCLILTSAGRDMIECLAALAAVFVYDTGTVEQGRIRDWFVALWKALEDEETEFGPVWSACERFVFENLLTPS